MMVVSFATQEYALKFSIATHCLGYHDYTFMIVSVYLCVIIQGCNRFKDSTNLLENLLQSYPSTFYYHI